MKQYFFMGEDVAVLNHAVKQTEFLPSDFIPIHNKKDDIILDATIGLIGANPHAKNVSMSGNPLPGTRGTCLVCPDCDTLHSFTTVNPGHDVCCRACGHILISRPIAGINHCLAFSLAGLILFLPANIYPVVTFSFHGVDTDNILLTGVIRLCQGGLPEVGVLVALTSILFPCLFLLGLIYVSLCSCLRHYPRDFAISLRLTRALARWSMIDVYLLACLVAFIKLGQLASVVPGPGLYCLFASLTCVTIATRTFDPDLLWRRYGASATVQSSPCPPHQSKPS